MPRTHLHRVPPAATPPGEHESAATIGAAVTVTDLGKVYGLDTGQRITAANELNLTVQPGSVVAVTGPSGSGKSTLLHLIGAIDTPDAGTITVDDTCVTDLTARRLARYRRTVGFVLAPVLPYRTTYDKRARGVDLLAAVDLAGRENSLPSRLSGGQQQRVAIARALVNTPRLLLADEPTGNLDSVTGNGILQLLLGLRARHGMTVILATHDPAIAAHADRLLRMRDGTIVDDIDLTAGETADITRLSGPG